MLTEIVNGLVTPFGNLVASNSVGREALVNFFGKKSEQCIFHDKCELWITKLSIDFVLK